MVFDIVKFEGNIQDVIWKSYVDSLSNDAKIYSRKDYDVVFLRNGAFLGAFDDREEFYQLDYKKQGMMDKIFNGKKTVENCEIYYINRVVHIENKWGTPNRIDIYDKDYEVFTSVGANGSYKFSIKNSMKLFSRVQGAQKGLTQENIKEFFRSEVNMEIRNIIATFFLEQELGVKDLALVTTLEKKISQIIYNQIESLFEPYGVKLENFIISQFIMEETFIQTINQIKKDAIINNLKQDILFEDKMKQVKKEGEITLKTFENEKPFREEDRKTVEYLTEAAEKLKKAEKDVNISISNYNNTNKICSECGKENEIQAKFCMDCGNKL